MRRFLSNQDILRIKNVDWKYISLRLALKLRRYGTRKFGIALALERDIFDL